MISPYEPTLLRNHSEVSRRAERNVAALISLGHWLGLATATAGALVLASYPLDAEPIWRPIADGPSTHPITAILFVIGGAAVASVRAFRIPWLAIAAVLVCALVGLERILESVSGIDVLQFASPFPGTLAREAAEGTPLSFGWNSAMIFLLVALALLLRARGRPRISQVVAASAMAPSLIAITGYVHGVAEFYGDMSVTTAVVGLAYATGPLLLSSRSGIMRAICSPWQGGRFGRLEIAVIATVVFVGGYLVHHANSGVDRATPLFVVIVILAASITIAFCTIVIERSDWQRRQAERTISQLVLRDALSSLYNRRFLSEQAKGITSFAKRKRYELSVLMLDIDKFKSINDTWGHPVGDKVIRRLADEIRGRLRSSDIAIRYGGEEILVILLDADLSTARCIAEDLRGAIEGLDFSDVGFRRATVSIGVAQVSSSLTEAIGRADVALYLAKQSGRNRVVANELRPRPALAASQGEADETCGKRIQA